MIAEISVPRDIENSFLDACKRLGILHEAVCDVQTTKTKGTKYKVHYCMAIDLFTLGTTTAFTEALKINEESKKLL